MNDSTKISDNQTKELLQKSKLLINNEDFTDALMQKIEAKSLVEDSIKRDLKRAWFFIISSVLFLPLSTYMIFSNIDKYFPFTHFFADFNTNNVMFVFITVLVLSIIFMIDKLSNFSVGKTPRDNPRFLNVLL